MSPIAGDVFYGSPVTRVIGIGEILWDELPGGRAIGGAPFNVVANLARLGHETGYVTAVGRDPLGTGAVAEIRRRGVDASMVQVLDGSPTGVARVSLGSSGSAEFEIVRPAAYQEFRLDDAVQQIAGQRPDALVFGTLAQIPGHIRAGTRQLAARLPGAVRLYDVNLRDGWWSGDLVAELAGLASVIKLTDSEAQRLEPALGVPWSSAEAYCGALADRFGLRGAAVSAGAQGASLWLDGAFACGPPPAVSVTDTVGAGDAFAAGLLDAIIRGQPAAAALRRANALGALVVSRAGALPEWTPAELAALEDPQRG
jgi:fructokinase